MTWDGVVVGVMVSLSVYEELCCVKLFGSPADNLIYEAQICPEPVSAILKFITIEIHVFISTLITGWYLVPVSSFWIIPLFSFSINIVYVDKYVSQQRPFCLDWNYIGIRSNLIAVIYLTVSLK